MLCSTTPRATMLQRCRPCLLRALAVAARDCLLAGKLYSSFPQHEAAHCNIVSPAVERFSAPVSAGLPTVPCILTEWYAGRRASK